MAMPPMSVVVVVRVFFVMGVRHGGDSTANQLIHPTSGNRNSRKFAALQRYV
jgi:hypothetical protein